MNSTRAGYEGEQVGAMVKLGGSTSNEQQEGWL